MFDVGEVKVLDAASSFAMLDGIRDIKGLGNYLYYFREAEEGESEMRVNECSRQQTVSCAREGEQGREGRD